ncbi:MAG: CDP-alcohol phosphatidyltransferase family protein [Leptospiraceae bacterium]|nr:CDP-alcohol phosphatidyltransferase family protein [Leptospiraceae bacterium]
METGKLTEELRTERVFTIPNMITSLRIFVLPFFIYYAIRYVKFPSDRTNVYGLVSTIFIAIVSDFLDGKVARFLKQESIIGKYLDPVCDKIVSISGLIVLVLYYEMPLWILIIYFVREILGVWLGTFLFFKRGIQGSPNIWGKLGVALTAITVLWYVFMPGISLYMKEDNIIKHPEYAAYTMILVLFLGAFQYSYTYWNIVFHPEKEKKK